MHFILALANTHCQMHYEIRSQKSSSSDPPTTGSTVTQGVTGRRPRATDKAAPGDWGVAPRRTWPREGGEALPFPLARNDRIHFRCAEACGPWLYIHGSKRNERDPAPPSAAPSPGHTAGPVLQHRPSETPPGLWTELDGLAM